MDWTSQLRETRGQIRELNKMIPETAKGFQALSAGVKDHGVLDEKTKEFVALGIAVADHCTDCIGFHIQALVRIGATREEISDVLAMTIQMGGGPSLMYAAKALDAFDTISKKD